MLITAQDADNRRKVRESLQCHDADTEVWQADSGALLIGEEPDTDNWRLIGTVAEYLSSIPAGVLVGYFAIGERVSDPEGHDGVVVDVGDERFSDYRRDKYCVDYDDEAPLTWWAQEHLTSRDR